MKRLINSNFILETSKNIKKQIEDLKSYQTKLNQDIDKISLCYKGIDSDLIIVKYKEKVMNLNPVIETLERYTNYFDWIAGEIKDNLEKTIKSFSESSTSFETIDNTLDIDLESGNNEL